MQFEKSADTKVLESCLAEAKVGDIVTYEALSTAIGRDVRAHAYAALRTARRAMLNDKGIVFGTEQNEGLRRLDDVGIIGSIEQDRRRQLRAAKTSLKKLSVVKFDELPEEKKREHVVASAQMGAMAMFASKNATKKISSQVNGAATQLAIGQTLKMFS